MYNLQYNFSGNKIVQKCVCDKNINLNNEHLYYCDVLNEGQTFSIPYIKLFNGTIIEQCQIVNILNENMNKYETYTQAQE